MTTLVELDDLSVAIRGLPVLTDVTLQIQEGEILGLVGETGSGKSLTCRALLGMLGRIGGEVTHGAIRFAGAEIAEDNRAAWRRLRGLEVGFVPQASLNALDPVMTVGAQLVETVRALDPTADARARSIELLALVEMPDPARVVKLYPHQLSGGMRQRVMIALALAGRPRLLVADEPTTALDVTVQKAILEVFSNLRQSTGMSVLLVTHDLGVVSDIADSLAVMYGGTVLEYGAIDKVLDDPRHPYTMALLGARPGAVARGTRLTTIAGQPAVPGSWPTGCRFAPRCSFAHDGCSTTQPALEPVSTSHARACHGWTASPLEAIDA